MDYIDHADVLYSLLKDREHSIGCEVGVHTGTTARYLLKRLPKIEKYYAIDPWKEYEMYDGTMYEKPGNTKFKTMESAMKNFFIVTDPYNNKLVPGWMTSVEASVLVPKNYLDWVFIDANHEYDYIKENLEIWSERVKPGGLVSGHDYGNKKRRGGVKQAVKEFVPKNKLKILPCYVWSFIR